MLYRINRIMHSGAKGKRGEDRTDGIYPKRVGRVVSIEDNYPIYEGYPALLIYVADANGNEYHGGLQTSRVVKLERTDNAIRLETSNSIYELIEIGEQYAN